MNFGFLELNKATTSEILEILNHNVIGTPGQSMLYQHLGVLNKIYKLADPHFVSLKRGKQVIATSCFCARYPSHPHEEIQAFYIRYFSFKERFRAKHGLQKRSSRKSLLRDEINMLLAGQGLLAPKKFYHYAYVDPSNTRSMTLCKEFGFETVRNYSSIIFNRLFPKDATNIDAVTAAEEPIVASLLKNFYREYAMLSFENLFAGRSYYVMRNGEGHIVAGAQANPDYWKVLSLPGLTGKIILPLFSRLPILNRLLNKDYRFLALDGIYCAEGHEKSLETLLETLLAKHKLHTAIAMVDTHSPLYKKLKSIDLGWVAKLKKEVQGDIICRFQGMSDGEKRIFYKQPAYISTIDVT